jgi:hypothetical protein
MKPEQLSTAIDQYFALEKAIKETLGWVDSWKVIPLEDERDSYWMIAGGNKLTGKDSSIVRFMKPITPAMAVEGKEIYGGHVYTQRDHDQWILRAGDIVLVPVDTQTDGNIFLYLLDAAKEIRNAEAEKDYLEYWTSSSYDD